MAAIKSVDHKGMEFPSFKAMCEHWGKKPATVRRRLKNWKSLELALEIPEIPGYRFKLASIGPNGKYLFTVKINPHYKQYAIYDFKHLSTVGINPFLSFERIKKTFPKNVRAFKKGQMIGIY